MAEAAIELSVNGEAHTYRGAGETPLLWVLRDTLGLKGTKYGCGVGVCGTCIVLVEDEPRHACMLAVRDVSGKSITTIEGFAAHPRHPVIRAWQSGGPPLQHGGAVRVAGDGHQRRRARVQPVAAHRRQ